MDSACVHDLPDKRGRGGFAFEHDIPRIVSLGYDADQFFAVHHKPKNRYLSPPFLPQRRALWRLDEWSKRSDLSVQVGVLRSCRAPFTRCRNATKNYQPIRIGDFDLGQQGTPRGEV